MENKELTQALESLTQEIEKKNDLKIKALQDKAVEDANKILADIATLKEDKATLQKCFDELQARQKDIKIGGEKQKTFGQQVFDKLVEKSGKSADNIEEAGKALYEMFKHNADAKINFNTKAAGTMTMANYTAGTQGLTSFEPGLEPIATRPSFMRGIVNTRPVTQMYVAWAEKANRDGAVTTVAEGAAKPQIDFDIVEATKKVEKIAGHIKATKESLADIPFLTAEINSELVEQINLVLDVQILLGDGVTPNLKGIMTYANTISFAGTPFALGIDQANNFDAIMATAAVIRNRFFNPNAVILNDLDAAMFNAYKMSTGQYILPPFSTADGQRISGLQVITNPGMTVGSFLVGDFSKDVLGIREEININVGYVNDDFTKNLVTIVGEMRAVNYIKANNVGAFAKGVFATVRAALETA